MLLASSAGARRLLSVSVVTLCACLLSWTDSGAQLPPADEEIAARTADLNKGIPLPDNDLLLFSENQRLDDEITKYRRALNEVAEDKSSADELEKLKAKATPLVAEVRQLKCKTAPPSSKSVEELRAGLRSISGQLVQFILFKLADAAPSPNPWSDDGVEESLGKQSKGCESLFAFVSDDQRQQALAGYFDQLRVSLADAVKKQATRRTQINNLLELLQKRRATVQEKMAARSSQQQISGSLWIVIGIIGALSVLAMVVVRLFDAQLQMEWVASGQVIQFVTVMILLSVILALGLANILRENTLGTLLGGIAGDVLAQGVGRAAAREMARAAQPLPTPAPIPPPAPVPAPQVPIT